MFGWFGKLRFQSQIIILMLTIVLTAIGGAALIAVPRERTAQLTIWRDRLRSIAEIKKTWIEHEFWDTRSKLLLAARMSSTIDAANLLTAAVAQAEAEGDDLGALRSRLRSPASQPTTADPVSQAYLTSYAVLDPILRDLQISFSLDDLLLVRRDDGLVLYSAQDPRASLRPLDAGGADNPPVRAYRRALRAPGDAATPALVFEDFAYDADHDGPRLASFAAPVFDGERFDTILVAVLRPTRFNAIMLEQSEIAEQISTYLVGLDRMPRSHIAAIDGTDGRIDHAGIAAALEGRSGAGFLECVGRDRVLGVWLPVELGDVRWALLSEMSESAVFASVNEKMLTLGAYWAVMALGLAVLALLFARRIDRPVRGLLRRTQLLAAGQPTGPMARSETSREFSELVDSFNEMSASIRERAVAAEREARAAIEEREARLRGVFDTAVEGILLLDAQGNVEAINASAERIFGVAAAEVVGRPFVSLLPAGPADDCRCYMAARCAEPMSAACAIPREIEALRRDGTTFQAELALCEMAVNGRRMFAAALRDITDRKRAERAVFESEQRLRRQNVALVELAKLEPTHGPEEGACVKKLVRTAAETLEASRASLWMLDDARQRLTCMRMFDAVQGEYACGQSLDAASFPAYFRAVDEERVIAAHDAATDPRTAEFLEVYLRPNNIASMLDAAVRVAGRTIGVVCFEQVGPPRTWLLDEQNFASALSDLVALLFESMERDKAEAALAASQERLQLTLSATNDAIWDWDIDTDVAVVNARFYEMCDVPPGPVTGAAWEATVHPDDLDAVNAAMQAHLTGAAPKFEVEYRQQAPGGLWLWILTRAKVVARHPDGRPRRVAGTQRDITDRRRAQQAEAEREAAEAASRAKSQFLANMSHELRTPLNGVLGYAQILQRDPAITAKQRECLEAIESCGRHLLTLINDVLDLSKIEAGRLDIRNEPLDLPRLLADVGHVVRQRAEAKGLAFEPAVGPEVPRAILSDATKLRQVLVNLLGNAVKFTEHGGVRLVVRESPRERLRFEVHDTGVGIPPEHVELIFDAFRQTEAGAAAGGTGLGLTISRRIVEGLGGGLHVDSTVGKGSCFWFDIPIVEADPAALPDGVGATGDEQRLYRLAAGQQVTVVIADDRQANRDILLRILEPAGFTLLMAGNGQEAVDLVRANRPAAVLMDVRMPVLNGLEATRVIRGDPRIAATCIIAVTASVFPDAQRQVREAGCDDMIGKPFRAAEIFAALERHLKLRLEDATAGAAAAPATGFGGGVSATAAREVAARLRSAIEIGSFTELSALVDELSAEVGDAALLGAEIGRHANSFDFDALASLAARLEEQAAEMEPAHGG